jgi:hypothetical protein
MIKYTDAVREGLTMVKQDDHNQWRWGELAANIEPVHGQATLETYAKEVGKEYQTLLNCETMWRAWEGTEITRRRVISPSVAMALTAYGKKKGEDPEKAKERRVALVKRKPHMTKREAAKETTQWREQHGDKPELNIAQLVMRIVNALDHILEEEKHTKLSAMLDAVIANIEEVDEEDRKLLVSSAKGVVERAEDLLGVLKPIYKIGSNVVSMRRKA